MRPQDLLDWALVKFRIVWRLEKLHSLLSLLSSKLLPVFQASLTNIFCDETHLIFNVSSSSRQSGCRKLDFFENFGLQISYRILYTNMSCIEQQDFILYYRNCDAFYL
eukprot:GHVP01054971.1.p1 GENE.GHVP01054971.1~~GHVP01054971.1.p1  ORF type:complete len:125 (+),score=12.90 GHVP01054971.1:52-375(+)